MALTTIILQWEGPFSLDEVCESDAGNGLYLLTGKKKYERQEQIQYPSVASGNRPDAASRQFPFHLRSATRRLIPVGA